MRTGDRARRLHCLAGGGWHRGRHGERARPTYIAEVAPADLRGRLGSLQQLAIVTGIFIALLSDFALAEIAGGAGEELALGGKAWQWMFFVEAVPAVVYGLGTLLIPKSPRFLVMKGRDDEAELVLRRITGGDARAKVAEIKATMDQENDPRLSDLRGPFLGLLPIVWVGILLSMFQQLVGINRDLYYSSILWNAVGFSESSSLLITVITSVTNILTTLVAIAYVDRIRRKPLLLIGSAGMAVSLGALTLVFGTAPLDASGQPDLGSVAGPVALVAANLFVVFFGMSRGPRRLGPARRDVPEPDPRRGPVGGHGSAVAHELRRLDDLPAAQGREPRVRVRHLRSGRPCSRSSSSSASSARRRGWSWRRWWLATPAQRDERDASGQRVHGVCPFERSQATAASSASAAGRHE